MRLVAFAQAAQNRNRIFDRRLVDDHRLKTSFERRVFLDVLAIFVKRRRADAPQFTAGQSRLEKLTGIRGPSTGMMFIAAVTLDREKQEIYTVDNDIGDRLMVFPYDAEGNVKPTRVLDVPHQAWGISIGTERNEFAVTVEAPREIVIYRKGAEGHEPPLRTIRGPKTRLGDPHGIFYDDTNNELVVSNQP